MSEREVLTSNGRARQGREVPHATTIRRATKTPTGLRDPRTGNPGVMEPRRRNVLVVSSVERPVAELRSALGDDVGDVRVVVPAVRQSRLEWLANDEDDARQRAEEAASEIAEA